MEVKKSMNTGKRKKLLIIAPEFGKNSSAGAFNNFHLASSLSNSFITYVITVSRKNKIDRYLSHKYLNIKYSSYGLIHLIDYFFRDIFSHIGKDNPRFTMKKVDKEISRINYYNAFTLKKRFFVPDTFIDWLPIGLWEGIKCIKKEKVDAIISSASPYTSHLIGYLLSRTFRLPLILFYQDPWVIEKSVKRGRLRFKIESYVESKIVHSAQLIIFCTESTRESYLKLFHIDRDRTSVVYFGFDPNDFDYSVFPTKGSIVNLVYGGRIVPGQRSIAKLLNTLKQLPDNFPIHIDIFVKEGYLYYKSLVKKLGIEKFITVRSPLDHGAFCQYLRRYDYLILLGNADPLQVPSKLYEYIGSRRPIFLIQNNSFNDETLRIVKSMNNSIIVKNEENGIKEALLKMVNLKATNLIFETPVQFASKFTWLNRGKEYIRLVKKVFNEDEDKI